jgi:eukaryotic-like serine/threonine-protein kinase
MEDNNEPKQPKKSSEERVEDLVRRGHLIYEGVDSANLEADVELQKTIVTKMGRQLSHYQILQKLGEGGMGEVYLARDTKLDRRVAIKVLPYFTGINKEGLKRFIREAKTASAVNHPNVAHIYEIGEQDSIHFIVMEFIEGLTLSEKISGHPLKNSEIIQIAIQIADALGSAHSVQIVHRDIKPKNIMIASSGQVKVLDFGLAKAAMSQDFNNEPQTMSGTLPGVVLGTAPYMSPEQVHGKLVDQRSDLFSFGIVLYEMSTGHLPFTGDRMSEIMEQIIHKTPAPVSNFNQDIPQELERIIFKCLEKEPGNRYQNVNDLLVDLRNLQRYMDSGAAVTTAKTIVKPSRAPHTFLLIILMVLLGFVLWRFVKPSEIQQTNLHTISTFPGSHGAASFSPDGSMIAFENNADGVRRIWIKNLNTGDPVPITPTEIPGSRPRWSPLNDQIVFSSGTFGLSRMTENIWTVPPLGGTPRKLIEHARNPNWSFDGKLLVFEREAEIWIANADGSNQRKVEGIPKVPVLVVDRFPAFSPDSSEIVFFQITFGTIGDYFIIPTKGGQPRQITFDHAAGERSCWTPDGKYIIFSSARKGSFTLWKIPASGGDPEAITTGAGPDAAPDISRDGKQLIFTNQKFSCTLNLYDSKTRTSHDLITMKEVAAPVFSNDGNKIAFFQGPHLFIVNKDGSGLIQLTRNNNESNIFPRWSRDDQSLFFYQEKPEPTFRKIAINGGASTKVFDNWIFEVENGTQLDPSEEYVVYAKKKEGRVIATVIRHIKTGKERSLPIVIDRPQWSKNGKWIAGCNYENTDGNIFICPADGTECRNLTKGITPGWSGDDSRIFFHRKGQIEDGAELWSIGIDGRNEKKETDMRPMSQIGFFYDVSPADEVAWSRVNLGPDELWLMEFGKK